MQLRTFPRIVLFLSCISIFGIVTALVHTDWNFQSFQYLSSDDLSEKKAFENVYKKKIWGEGSGIGSKPENAKPYINLLQKYLEEPKIDYIVDLGCGDWQIMANIKIPNNKHYIGYDLVDSLIAHNNAEFGKENVKFISINRLNDIQAVKGDLLIVKDVLHHWPTTHINYFLKYILPNFKYALITNDYNLYASNHDIKFGDFRPINLKKEPFMQVDALKVLFDYPSHGITKRVYLYQNPASL